MHSNPYEFFYKGPEAITALVSLRKNYLTVQKHTN
jgi:hypothetical protein